jgi:hypothetical protein
MREVPPVVDGSRAERHALGLLIVTVIVGRLGGDDMGRHIPFLPWLDHLGRPADWIAILSISWWTGVLLLCTPWFRLGALLAGTAEMLRVLGSMPLFSNGRAFDALLLIMVALSSASTGLRWLRLQYLLLYLGAALNKMFEPDWWNGEFMVVMLSDSWLGARLTALPEVPVLMGWLSMATEAAIPVLLLIPKRRAAGVWLCLAFHSVMLLMLREDFATFFYAVALGAVFLFYPLPDTATVSVPSGLAGLVPQTSSFSAISNAPRSRGGWSLQWGQAQLSGRAAAMVLLLCSLPAQVLVLLLITTASRVGAHDVRESLLGLLVAAGAVAALQMRRTRAGASASRPLPVSPSV